MNDVFISYSRRDKVFVQKLYECLTAANRTVWADWDSIPAASDWDAEIKQGIQETNSVLFLLSPEWIKSNECRKEMIHAVAMGKRLFPILYLPVDPNDVPPELAKINWVYMRDTDDFDKAFQTLCSAMDTDLDWIKTHTRIQVRALEWEKKNRSASFALRGEDLTEGEQFISGATGKSPEPTHLQGEYILASRTDATRRQRQTLAGVTIALVVSIALGIVAFFQRQEAVRQSQIALARQLAAQGQLLNTNKSSKQLTASLLSIQSIKLEPNSDAASFLLNNNFAAQPVLQLYPGGQLKTVTFSQDGKYIASTGCDNSVIQNIESGVGSFSGYRCLSGSVHIWETESGNEVNQFSASSEIYNFSFIPDKKYIVYGSCDHLDENFSCLYGSIHVADILTGKDFIRRNVDFSSFAVSQRGEYIVAKECDKPEDCADAPATIWETLTGKDVLHTKGKVASFAISPDSKDFVSLECTRWDENYNSCAEGFVRVLDITTNKEVAQLPFVGLVSEIAFSPNGRYLVLTGFGYTKIYRAFDWAAIANMEKGLAHIVFSSDSNYLMSTTPGAFVTVWETSTGKEVSNLQGGFIFSPGGKYVVSAPFYSPTIIWDTETGEEVMRVTRDSGNDSSAPVAFSLDGKYFVMGSDDGTVRAWEIATGKEIARMTHDDQVSSIIFSPNGQEVASSSYDGTVRLWKIATNREALSVHLEGDDNVIIQENTLVVVNCNKRDEYSFCTQSTAVSTLEIPSGKVIAKLKFDKPVKQIQYSADGTHMLLVECDQWDEYRNCLHSTFRIWGMLSGKEISRTHPAFNGLLRKVSLSPNGKLVATEGCDELTLDECIKGPVQIWNAESGEAVLKLDVDGDVDSLVFSPDGKYVAATSHVITEEISSQSNQNSYGIIYMWDSVTGQEAYRMTGNNFRSLTFSPDGKYFISVTENVATVRETLTGKEVSRMSHDGLVESVAFSPNGRYIVSGGEDKTARVWEVATGNEISRTTHNDIVIFVAISPDGEYVASKDLNIGTGTTFTCVWEATTGKEVIQRDGVYNYSQLLAFSPDGRYIIDGGHVWMWQPEDVITNACAYLPRNLTRAEWEQFIGDAMPYQAVCENLPIEHEPTETPTATP